MFSGHQTTATGIRNINGVPIPAQPALLPTNQGYQRTATNWTSSQPTLTHQSTQPVMRSYQEGFLGTTTAYNPTNMPTSSTTAFTHAGCRGPTGTTHPNINRPPTHQHAVHQHAAHQHAAHQNQPTYFRFRPTLEQHRQTTNIIKRSRRHSENHVKPFIFDGEPEQWLDWIGLFNAIINSTDMTISEKMTHLQKLISGGAKSLIRGYGCNGAKYDAALQRLENDFGNPTKIVTSFLRPKTAAAAATTTTAATLKDHHPTVTPTNMDHRITAPIRTTGTSNAASSNINLDKRINDEIFARRNAMPVPWKMPTLHRNEPKGQITACQGPTTMFQLPQPPQVRRLPINANLPDGRMQ